MQQIRRPLDSQPSSWGGVKVSSAVSDIAVARIVEQGSLFMGAMVLAADSAPEDFAVAALLFTVTSAGASLADVGVGLQILRTATRGIPLPMLSSVGFSGLLAVGAFVSGAITGGTLGMILIFGGVIWALSGVAQIGRAITLSTHNEHLILRSSLCGALTLLCAVSMIPSTNVGVVAGVGLVAKLSVETALLGRIPVLRASKSKYSWHVFGNQALNFAGSNADYVLVGLILGRTAFAIYALAFRLSSGVNSVASFTIARLATVRLAEIEGAERPAYLRRLVGPVFGIGVLGAGATCMAAPLLTLVVDERWTDLVIIVQILALMLPFRLIHGLLGVAFLVEHADRMLMRLEFVRISISLLLLSAAATRGLVALSVMALVLSIVSVGGTAAFLQRTTMFQLIGVQRLADRPAERTTRQ